ncbi:hypothetical protein PNB18_000850 [Salmonella enterica]|nr:hypothetical protein [Salmonella enterica]EAM4664378.1 hypothetical protein [Salmonella enterica]EAQ6665231.1 hypothetical protein [Salmonella enterica]EAT2222980.1 hypothetical protein [Salmonella enterica]EAW0874461.1 hypothetical protein [Salmonella enterica]
MSKHRKNKFEKKLYRTVNTTTYNVPHLHGDEYRWDRSKNKIVHSELPRFLPMSGKTNRGLDYTPLFMFLLSKTGEKWDQVYSEAIRRLDKPDPVFWLVALHEKDRMNFVRCGESSYYNGLYVDEDGYLKKVSPDLKASDIPVFCNCCTYTLNGKTIKRIN